MNTETTIILCGGPINYSNLPIGTNLSNAMIPVNGKPVIGWILDDLLAKGIDSAVVVLRERDLRLRRFLEQAYSGRMDIATAPLLSDGTILHSLLAGLHRSPSDGLVRIILGDTLIHDDYHSDSDFVYVGEVEDSRRWCLVESDEAGRVSGYIDKNGQPQDTRIALAGYYHLMHGCTLQRCVEQAIEEGESELSAVLKLYGLEHPIKAELVQKWYDFGHIDHLVAARRQLLQPRYFNSLTINPVLNTITKVSQNAEKLRDELDWYLSVPDDLKVLTPRIVRHESSNGSLEVVQEYYGYPTLAELYVYGDLHADTWSSILRRVLAIHDEFRKFSGSLNPAEIESVYLKKTFERLDALRKQDQGWAELISSETILFNNRKLRNIFSIKDTIDEAAVALAATAKICVVHGDFCFSNILFDVNNQIIRLIDPRGSFGKKGIYGDPRYDIAKLRHSVNGLYDFIVADMFQIEGSQGRYEGQLYANGTPAAVGSALDRAIQDNGYDLREIRLIEGLLFISMVPLHQGHPRRQLMMYLTGLSLLNEVIENANCD